MTEVTITPGILEWKNADGVTGQVNLAGATSASTIPYALKDAPEAPVIPGVAPAPSFTTHYKVRVHLSDGREFDLFMGQVDNQVGWTDTVAGAEACADAVAAAFT